MNGLYLHCGTSQVDRATVERAYTPPPTETHFPIPHRMLLDELERNLEQNGFQIDDEAHALTRDGARYFGLLRVSKQRPVWDEGKYLGNDETIAQGEIERQTFPCMDEPNPGSKDFGLVIGLRNAHDLSVAAALVMGGYVWICDNLGMSGEVLIGRKHTRFIERDLPLMMPRAFGALGAEKVKMESRIAAYKDTHIDDRKAHDLIVRSLVDERVFPVSNLPAIVNEWRKPRHPEFEPRTVWSLSNAYTEIAKPAEGRRGNLQTLTKRTQNLYGFFDKQLGLSLDAKLN